MPAKALTLPSPSSRAKSLLSVPSALGHAVSLELWLSRKVTRSAQYFSQRLAGAAILSPHENYLARVVGSPATCSANCDLGRSSGSQMCHNYLQVALSSALCPQVFEPRSQTFSWLLVGSVNLGLPNISCSGQRLRRSRAGVACQISRRHSSESRQSRRCR